MDYEVINRQAYDANSDYYSNIYNNIKLGDERKLIDMFTVRSSKVLDLGSGNGFFAKLLSLNNLDVICLDNSKEMLKKCENKKKILASLERIPLGNESLDGVFASCSLLHLPKERLPAALEESRRVLVKHGTLYMTMKTGNDSEGIVEADGIKRFQATYSEETLFGIVKSYFDIAEIGNKNLGKFSLIHLLCINNMH